MSRNLKISKKNFIIIGILVLAVIGGLAYYLQQRTAPNAATTVVNPVNTVDYSQPSAEDNKETEEQKDETIKQNEARGDTNTGNTGTATLTISRVGQVSSDNVSLRSIINGGNDGQCVARFTKGSTTVSRTFAATNTGSYYACNNDVAISEFASSGEWDLNLTYTATNNNTASANAKVTISR